MTIEIIEKHPTADAYKVGAAFTEYCILAKEKRFSDAELAAEYWAPTWLTMPNADWDKKFTATMATMKHRQEVLLRFATLPHFDA